MNIIESSLDLLGCKVRDRVTGFAGVATSITFDLYGCVQAIITPEVGPENKNGDPHWFDVKRIEKTTERVMPKPAFGEIWPGQEIGCGDRPRQMPR